jgi:uncharacterized protein YecT (DUF1311 family)
MKDRSLFASLLLISMSAGASAGAKYCGNEENTVMIIACHEDRYRIADQEMNVIYKESMKSLLHEEKKKLKQAQLAWLKYRDTNIAFISELEMDSRSYGRIVVADYKAKIVEKRVLELKHMLSGPAGPMVDW